MPVIPFVFCAWLYCAPSCPFFFSHIFFDFALFNFVVAPVTIIIPFTLGLIEWKLETENWKTEFSIGIR